MNFDRVAFGGFQIHTLKIEKSQKLESEKFSNEIFFPRFLFAPIFPLPSTFSGKLRRALITALLRLFRFVT